MYAILGAIARLEGGNPLKEVAIRQLSIKTSSSKSWFTHVNKLGEKKGLDIHRNVMSSTCGLRTHGNHAQGSSSTNTGLQNLVQRLVPNQP